VKASACVIGHITVPRSGAIATAISRVPATLAPWGAQLLLRGEKAAVLGGSHAHQATVVILFPDLDAVNGWYASADYRSLIPLREQAADLDLVSFSI